MKATYDPEEKQLTLIASNPEEQDEFEGLAAVMRHGDEISLGYTKDTRALMIGGNAIKKRWGFDVGFSLEVGASDKAVSDFADGFFNYACSATGGGRAIFFLWAGEIPEDGWNTLVFSYL
ncbi:MAG: hypothetical protein WC473_02340 [Patescibacteria group bacterium]